MNTIRQQSLFNLCAYFLFFFLSSYLLFPPSIKAEESSNQDTYKNLEVFANVLSILKNNYVEPIDSEEVIQGAIKGMLTSLDPHSSYLKPENFRDLQIETQGSFSGIGIEITMKDGILTVVSPIEGTPAEKNGIQAGDAILKIEGEQTKDITLMEAVELLRGEKGSTVTIAIHREGWTKLKEITITRDVIPLHSVKYQNLEPGYAYIRITNFQVKTTKDTQDALAALQKDAPIQGLILDLRNNPGGLLDQAAQISDLFLDDGIIVSTKGRIPNQDMEFQAHPNGSKNDFPIIVLVNQGSASASEIVAGALQDHKRALILGVQTFGKGSVQTVIPMTNGAGLRITTARYYTPNGTSIQAKGITPDMIVENKPSPPQSNAEKKSPDPEQPHYIREKDLKHHITTGSQPKKEDSQEKSSTSEVQLSKRLQKDLQLKTALMILKGLIVFESITTK